MSDSSESKNVIVSTISKFDFIYLEQQASKWTFEMLKVKKWVEDWSQGKVLNLYAGKTKLNLDETRIDVSSEFKPDHCMLDIDFLEFALLSGMKYDTIILDPPYSLRKSMEKYKDKHRSKFSKVKNLIMPLLNNGARVITFGYSSNNMGKGRQFKLIALALICHFGASQDTIATVEQRHPSLEEWI